MNRINSQTIVNINTGLKNTMLSNIDLLKHTDFKNSERNKLLRRTRKFEQYIFTCFSKGK